MEKLSEKDAEVFQVLLVHWINHNGEHVEGYREWSEKMAETEPKVAAEIDKAIDDMQQAARKLMEAKIKFQES